MRRSVLLSRPQGGMALAWLLPSAGCSRLVLCRANADIYKMETLSDLMKKHKDAFHREYDEFGPVSEWTPDAVAGKSVSNHAETWIRA